MSEPLVGITAWRRDLDTFLGPERLQTLSDFYVNAVAEAGMRPVIIPNGQNTERAERYIEMVDGLLLSGGGDIVPATYGATLEHAEEADDSVDRFEIALIQAAKTAGKPVLGICRGLEVLNVALGGSLHQNIARPGTVHEPVVGDPDEINSRRHVVTLEPDSELARWHGSDQLKVNTLHHQGIAALAPELIPLGRTEDGLIEAASAGVGWWAYGVQWHPERMDDPLRQPLFAAFREAITQT